MEVLSYLFWSSIMNLIFQWLISTPQSLGSMPGRDVFYMLLSTIWVDVEKKRGLWRKEPSFRGRNPESKQVRGQNKQCIWNPDFRQAFNPKPTVTYFWNIWLRNSVPGTWNTIDTERKKKQKQNTHSSQFKESFISRGESEPGMKSKADWLRLGYLNYMLPERNLVKRVWNCINHPLPCNKLCQKLTSSWE